MKIECLISLLYITDALSSNLILLSALTHLHLVILQMFLSKATYNWGIHKVINLEEGNIQRKCQ